MQIEKFESRKDYQNIVSFVVSALKEAEALEVKSDEDEKRAIELRGAIKDNLKKADEIKKFVVDPYKTFIKTIESKFSFTKELKEATDILGRKMVVYQEKKMAKIEKEKEKIMKKALDGKADLSEAVKIIEEKGAVEKSVEHNGHKVTYREDRYVEIEDETKIPREYLVPDMVLIRKSALKDGKEIPGVVIKTKRTPVQL